jgi:hypothetical protein
MNNFDKRTPESIDDVTWNLFERPKLMRAELERLLTDMGLGPNPVDTRVAKFLKIWLEYYDTQIS